MGRYVPNVVSRCNGLRRLVGKDQPLHSLVCDTFRRSSVDDDCWTGKQQL